MSFHGGSLRDRRGGRRTDAFAKPVALLCFHWRLPARGTERRGNLTSLRARDQLPRVVPGVA